MSNLEDLGFDAGEHNTEQAKTVPTGIYELEVSESDVKETKENTGHLLKLTIDVLAPESQKGRKIFIQMNIRNNNPVAQKIGQEDLAKLSRACGVKPKDSKDLHFIRFTAKVGFEKKQDGYEQKNKISRYYYPDEGDVPAAKLDDAPANDNRPAASDNSSARTTQNGGTNATPRPAAAGGKKVPW